ncbi:hypothetical protein [Nocardiopsis gilva]|uniref:hypothetical protein n=1 Tax=Nocardiopsis gilva TaxID=280236 RepID=UPI0003487FF7|nr:hypothetical protein [Nocardiopsis gilva]
MLPALGVGPGQLHRAELTRVQQGGDPGDQLTVRVGLGHGVVRRLCQARSGRIHALPGAGRHQRHTTKRVFDGLVTEHGATDPTYGIIRRYVAQGRDEIRTEAGRRGVRRPRPCPPTP